MHSIPHAAENPISLRIRGDYLAGKRQGINARDQLKLDDLDKSRVVVGVSIEARYATSSFFLGLFSGSVHALGMKGFWEHYNFVCNQYVRDEIDKAVFHAAKTSPSIIKA